MVISELDNIHISKQQKLKLRTHTEQETKI